MARASHGFLPIGGMAEGLSGTAVALLPVAAAVFFMAALVAFLCASSQTSLHRKSTKAEKKGRLPTTCTPPPPRPQVAAPPMEPETMKGECRKLVSSLSSIGIRALQVAKTMSWKKRQVEEEEEEENLVWKKRILMGGKCQPLNFSGKIEYDCRGKQVKGFP
ncbi:hypothetical protein Taro_053424 [Colocasia esculenta]|uniref:Uncharacterized protein n=1 Tax=Colocasia esculenta TaxID=4460 RepID=A0A843XM52_COLES|nr:hypothetical protein [Colocasia esculenta]